MKSCQNACFRYSRKTRVFSRNHEERIFGHRFRLIIDGEMLVYDPLTTLYVPFGTLVTAASSGKLTCPVFVGLW